MEDVNRMFPAGFAQGADDGNGCLRACDVHGRSGMHEIVLHVDDEKRLGCFLFVHADPLFLK